MKRHDAPSLHLPMLVLMIIWVCAISCLGMVVVGLKRLGRVMGMALSLVRGAQ